MLIVVGLLFLIGFLPLAWFLGLDSYDRQVASASTAQALARLRR